MNAPSANLPWSEQYRVVAKQWVDADAAADLLEELKSATLAQLMSELGDMPVSRAEMTVKSDVEWSAYIKQMVEARQKANKLKVQLEYLRMKFSEWQSHEATKRTEARL
jgi:hypothetical protein